MKKILLFGLLIFVFGCTNNENLNILIHTDTVYALPGFLITLFSALRLAKFNIDTRQTSSFVGVPTPAITLFVLSIFLIAVLKQDEFVESVVATPWMLYLITLSASYALVAELPLFAMKFKVWNWQDNKIRWVFVGIVIALLAIFQLVAVPLIIIVYVLLSVVNNLMEE